VNTHAYLYSDHLRLGKNPDHQWTPQKYGIGNMTGDDPVNDGEILRTKFISRHPNILFVFCRHVSHVGGANFRIDKGEHRNNVYQIWADFQSFTKGGEGYFSIFVMGTKGLVEQ
jgi:hypothetical protein